MQKLMTKGLSVFLALVFLLVMFPATVVASSIDDSGNCGDRGDNVAWTLDIFGCLTISGTGKMMDYDDSDPPWIGGTMITRIEIESGVTHIGNCSFANCYFLNNVSVPDTLISIGDSAFEYCSNITEFVFPAGLNEIGSYAFNDCRSITELRLPASISNIGYGAFSGCTGLTTIALEEGCENYVCTDGVLYSSDQTYLYLCERSKQGSFTIPSDVTNIEMSAFEGCRDLTEIEIPEGVQWISSYAFDDCSSLYSIRIPASVSSLCSFSGCSALTALEVAPDNTKFSSEAGVLYDKAKTTLIRYPSSKQDSTFSTPNSVTLIKSHAFEGCSFLTGITLPAGITSIEFDTFSDCVSLAGISIPEGVTKIESFAFQNCSGLKEISIPASVAEIGGYAFYGCTSLQDVYYPSDGTWENISIGSNNEPLEVSAFHSLENNTPGKPLSIISILPDKATVAKGDTITWTVKAEGGVGSLKYAFQIYLDTDSEIITAYSSIFLPDNTAVLVCPHSGTFTAEVTVMDAEGNTASLTGAPVLAYTTSIIASGNCGEKGDELKWMLDDEGTLTITGNGRMADFNVDILTGYTESPWVSNFWSDPTIQKIVLTPGITYIGRYAFAGCSALELTTVTIPDSVTDIGQGAFQGCSHIEEISIPYGVRTIRPETFNGCFALASISIPKSVTAVEDYAFDFCSSLTDVYYGGDSNAWALISIHDDDLHGNAPLTEANLHFNTPMPESGNNDAPVPLSSAPVVQASTQKLAVDGVEKAIEHYNIDGSNYFKLRDLACLLAGTSNTFDVGYDSATRTVTVTTGAVYTPLATDLQIGTDESASAVVSSQSLTINGEAVCLTAYNIGGNNYFMLRDLAPYLGFEVDYNAETRTALILTSDS